MRMFVTSRLEQGRAQGRREDQRDDHRQRHRRDDGDRKLPVDDAGGTAKECHRQKHGGKGTEEHTTELQSLMLISYAIFYFKKKRSIMQIQSAIKNRVNSKNNI